mgnify:CR=1 FL=1
MAGKTGMSKVPGRLEVWKTKLSVGQVFGYWKVLPDPKDLNNVWFSGKSKGGSILVQCECTSCGNSYQQRPSYLLSGKTKSCRNCAQKKLRTGALNTWSWKGYEEIQGSVLSNLRTGAKRRGIKVSITLRMYGMFTFHKIRSVGIQAYQFPLKKMETAIEYLIIALEQPLLIE